MDRRTRRKQKTEPNTQRTGIDMANSSIFASLLLLSLVFSISWAAYNDDDVASTFLDCLSSSVHPSDMLSSGFFTQANASFVPLLESISKNSRFLRGSIVKPAAIFTPFSQSDVQAAVVCARKNNIHLRVLSGGHDYEGLSYFSTVMNPLVVIDLQNLRLVSVNPAEETAWVQSGATIGELYYHVAQRSNNTMAFPAGVCPTIGVGGHIVGGGFGTTVRKYGLTIDHALDAFVVDPDGKLLDRESMGENLFWALRGGGGQSFGILTAWKISLVPVPQNVTVFAVPKTLEQGGTSLMTKWQQVADKVDEELFIRVVIVSTLDKNSKKTVTLIFQGLYLGGADSLLQIMGYNFSQLGLARTDCTEMSWIQSILFFANYPKGSPIEVLLKRGSTGAERRFKAKADFFASPIPSDGLQQLWQRLYQGDGAVLIMNPLGGFMKTVREDEAPFPHRNARYIMEYLTYWEDAGEDNKHLNWMRALYAYMAQFATKNPRQAFFNYRDSDLGINKNNRTSFKAARDSWGRKYFMNNFEKLSRVKAEFDRDNFFWNEQSIPPMS